MAVFIQVGTVKVNETTTLVCSKVTEDGVTKGFNLNSYINSAKYKGFTKGTFVPAGLIDQYIDMLKAAVVI